MEERDPPPPPPHDNKPNLPDISASTYVVQVPKDQIYRVPPPENAHIADLHRNSAPRQTKCKGGCCLVVIIILIVVISTILFIGSVLGGLFSMVLAPKSPRFSIERFHIATSTPDLPQYDLVLHAYNPNSKIGILYKEGGSVSLSLRRQQVASGDYPSFYQPNHNSTAFGVALSGSEARLPEEAHVTFSLAIHVQVINKMGMLRSGTMKYDAACLVTVDPLAKNTQAVSQQCETKRH